jgi:hypothetical protein
LTNSPPAETIKELSLYMGLWRSLGARFHGMEEAVGSIPTRSTNLAPPVGVNFGLTHTHRSCF